MLWYQIWSYQIQRGISLNLLKILVVICLALHIVLLFELFILSKVKRNLLLHAIIITSSFTLLGIKLIVTTSFGFHIMATVGYNIDCSFWTLFISTLFCLFVLLLTLFKSLGHPKSFSKEDMTNNIVSIDYKTVTYIENDRKNMQKNYTDSYILSKYGSCLIAPSHDHRWVKSECKINILQFCSVCKWQIFKNFLRWI